MALRSGMASMRNPCCYSGHFMLKSRILKTVRFSTSRYLRRRGEDDDDNEPGAMRRTAHHAPKADSEIVRISPNMDHMLSTEDEHEDFKLTRFGPKQQLRNAVIDGAAVSVPSNVSELQKDVQRQAPRTVTHWMDNRPPEELRPWLDKIRGPHMARHQSEVASHMQLYFDDIPPEKRNKETFRHAISTFSQRDKRRAGHVDFIQAALRRMKEFGSDKDLQCYKDLMDTFPKGKFIAQNMWQVEFQHYPRQQDCGLDILNQMEMMGVLPDVELFYIVLNTFGDRSFVMRKYKRMKYWMLKFNNANPFGLPRSLSDSDIDLARLCLKRMCPDVRREIFVHFTTELGKSYPVDREETWMAFLLCPDQANLIARHPVDKPLFVEGEYLVWARERQLKWFQLRADPDVPMDSRPEYQGWYEQPTDLNFSNPFNIEYPVDLIPKPTIHEQEDGNTLSICMTGDSSRESLIGWISLLQERCPKLRKIPVLFRIRKILRDTAVVPAPPDMRNQQHQQSSS